MTNIERAENVAEEVFDKFERKIPVNPIIISEALGIPVYEGHLKEGIDGVLSKDEDEWRIYINKDHPPVRKRFSVAHELGHYYMHQHDAPKNASIIDYRSSLSCEGQSQREMEANAFAAALLMNQAEVAIMWKTYGSVAYLAESFGVSNEAMKYRLINLGLLKEDKPARLS